MHAMVSSGSAKVESARMWQESALHVDYRVLLSQAKGGSGAWCLRFVWAESLLGVLEC
ncbi:hypothetical protein V8E51_004313 [Hyaloscypha variabilis]